MCGITGIIDCFEPTSINTQLLQTMTQCLRHRGPDDVGYHTLPGVGFGFNRLSIVDLATGNQPHFNEDHSLFSICNGELYNYREIREELESKGHQFRTQCDVEILVHLYEEHGTEFIRRLNGQFAFAIYDRNKRRLLLARDHVGIAPLFYTQTQKQFLFGSEIKSLLSHPAISREVNLTGLDQIVTFPGLVSPTTMFKDVHSLKPGHYLILQEGKVHLQEYWDLHYPQMADISHDKTETGYIQGLDERLTEAVRFRLQADVPVGFYISGGLDSSLIAAKIHALTPREQRHSFSITFPQAEINERRYQQIMAEQVGSIHHETVFDHGEIIKRLQDVIYYAECPLKESYDTCSLALSELVHRAGLKVVLTGEGADELFAGYVGYRLDQNREWRQDAGFDAEAMLEEELREELWGDSAFFYERDYYAFRETKSALYSPRLAERMHEFDSTQAPVVDRNKIRHRHPLHQRSYVDFKLRIADHLVADHGDRVAYANSVEARYPFLDPTLIDYAATMPPDLFVREDIEKYLLRQVAKPYLPSPIMEREKFGFVAPGSPYLLQNRVEWVQDLLSYERIRRQGYFNPDTVERLKTIYSQPGASINTTFELDLLMIVLTFQIFADCFHIPDAR
ncbi:asparagine synthase (glutamine-hydrolyzing) [bacterium]|nr:asparagine synthase (glutamine-hydrolyzing) [bacterium]